MAQSDSRALQADDGRRWTRYASRVAVRFLLGVYWLFVRGLRRLRRRKRTVGAPCSILLTGTFYSENWIMNHVRPLAASRGCRSVWLVCIYPIPATPNVRQIAPPRRLCRAIGETPARLAVFAWIALRRRPDVIGGFHLLANGLAAALLAAVTGARAFYFCGGGPREVLDGGIHGNPVFARLLGAPDPAVEAALLRCLDGFDLIVTMGPRAADFFRQRGVRAPFAAIPGGIDGRRYDGGGDASGGEARYDLIAVGRLAPVKRFDIFLEAVALLAREYPALRAVVVGAGEDEAALKEQARRLALGSQVEFAGYQPDVAPWLRKSEVFVLTSESEGLSLALMEAMTAGLPAVVSDVGELGELVTDGVTGYLVREHVSPEAFAAPLRRLLGDAELRARMGAAARATAARYELCETARTWDNQLMIDD